MSMDAKMVMSHLCLHSSTTVTVIVCLSKNILSNVNWRHYRNCKWKFNSHIGYNLHCWEWFRPFRSAAWEWPTSAVYPVATGTPHRYRHRYMSVVSAQADNGQGHSQTLFYYVFSIHNVLSECSISFTGTLFDLWSPWPNGWEWLHLSDQPGMADP